MPRFCISRSEADASSREAAPVPGGIGVTLDHRLRAAIAHMRTHVSEKTSIDEIAADDPARADVLLDTAAKMTEKGEKIQGLVGLSRAHFFALFRDQLHTTPQVFWRGVRAEEAMRRVSDGGELTDVALDLGFSAPGKFSRFFKEHPGISPSIFKRAMRAPSPVTVTGIPRERRSF